MAQSPLANDPGERYAELERAYTEDRWPDVLTQGGQLIADLGNDPDPVTADLASRAHLLLGHAHLYGLRNPAAALPHYQAVLTGPADPDLRRIAEEALPYCQPAVGTTSPEAEAAEAAQSPQAQGSAAVVEASDSAGLVATAVPMATNQEPAPWSAIETTAEPLGEPLEDHEGQWMPRAGTAKEAITEPATPWLEEPIQPATPISLEKTSPSEVGGVLAVPGAASQEAVPSLEVEVVEEPELMEVAQADPSLAEELEIELTRIRERRAADRREEAADRDLVIPAPAAEDALEEPADDLMTDPELIAGLLRVVVTP